MLAVTGLRASEILGLRVKDCNFGRSLIFVRQTAWEGKIIQGTKTEGSKKLGSDAFDYQETTLGISLYPRTRPAFRQPTRKAFQPEQHCPTHLAPDAR